MNNPLMPGYSPDTPAFTTCARGKLLLTGEYVVLDGALALAMPVRYGQSLTACALPGNAGRLEWESLLADGSTWFSAVLRMSDLEPVECSDNGVAATLSALLRACRAQKPAFLSSGDWKVTTALDFPRAWGLGTSSTLVAALGRWSGADPYRLLFDTMGGSGYDIACAYADGPLFYQLQNGVPFSAPAVFEPAFSRQLFFVYQGQKQDSRAGIRHYRTRETVKKAELVANISRLTRACAGAQDLETFIHILTEHEQYIGEALQTEPVQQRLFPDFDGVVKSLGAWGGDFMLAAGRGSSAQIADYFSRKGFETVISWEEMCLLAA